MYRAMGAVGILVFLGIAFALSESRKRVNWHTVLWGILLQFVFALVILLTKAGEALFSAARFVFEYVIGFSDKGAAFVFGNLVNDTGVGAMIAFKVLPIIIFVSSLMGVLSYLGVIQFFVVQGARIMRRSMKLSGAEALGAAFLVFMGIEAMTALRSYLRTMTRSELFTVMSAFMATIATSVMAAYASFGAQPGHLLAASVMSAPSAIVIAKLMVPETRPLETSGNVEFRAEKTEHTIIEAAANGASVGLQLALQIGAMLIAFVGLLWLLSSLFGLMHTSFEQVLGIVYYPFALLMGVPGNDAQLVGNLLGTRTVFNEFIAYLHMKELIAAGALSPRSVVIATYALCGFANFGSLAILIGGIGGIVPERKQEVASLGIKSIVAGTLACFMTAAMAGILIP